jgi:quinol monooxygenase YgiN
VFCVVYQWKVKPGMSEQFRSTWRAITEAIFRQLGSLGSRLHEAQDGTWVAYAQWPDREHWSRIENTIGVESVRALQAECLEEGSKVLFELTVTDDLLSDEPLLDAIAGADDRLVIKRGAGVSQVMRKRLGDRIAASNVRAFLQTIGWLVNYDFDSSDWEEVVAMLLQSDQDAERWCDYEMIGSHAARIRLARSEGDTVAVDVNVPVELLPQARLAVEIFGNFKMS